MGEEVELKPPMFEGAFLVELVHIYKTGKGGKQKTLQCGRGQVMLGLFKSRTALSKQLCE